MEIRSNSFQNGEWIPKDLTKEGENTSPELSWKNLPESTRELALICEDPDAPMDEPFVHWVMYHIPPDLDELPARLPAEERLSAPEGVFQGRNSFEDIGYGGPLPPEGHGPHRYFFRLYALDTELSDLAPGATKEELLDAMEGHVLATAEWVGKYERN